ADVNTGLVWEKLSDDGTVHDKDNLYTWANAFTGHVARPTCSCTASSDYWSSTSSVSDPSGAWYVTFSYGRVDAFGRSGGKSSAAYVRAVRDATASTTTTSTTTSTASSTTVPGSACNNATVI